MAKTLHYNFATDKSLKAITGPTLTCTRALGTATRYNASGVLETVAADTARFDHDPVTLASLGLLVENAATNLCLQSEDFGTTWTTNAAAVVTADQTTSPDGTTNADKLGDDGGTSTGSPRVDQTVTVATATTYCFSTYAKQDQLSWVHLYTRDFTTPGNAFSSFNLSSGAVGTKAAAHDTSGIEDAGNGWYRCWITFTTDAVDTAGSVRIYVGDADNDIVVDRDGTSSIFIWGAQLEAGSIPTSYIATTSAAVTRNADDISTSTVSWLDAAATAVGTFYVKASVPSAPAGGTGTKRFPIHLDDGTTNHRVWYELASNASSLNFRTKTTGDNGSVVGAVMADGVSMQIAGAYANNDVIAAVDGVLKTQDTTAALPMAVSMTTFRVGNQPDGSESWNGHIQEIRYYDERLSDGALKTLTIPTRNLSPLGLVMNRYGPFRPRDAVVTLLGASIQADAGVVNVVSDTGNRQQFAPHGLPTKPRNFSKQISQDVNVYITGAQIQAQWNTPGFSDPSIYVDGAEISTGAGTVLVDAGGDAVIELTGAEIGATAGTVTAGGGIDVSITGAEISADAGEVTAFGAGDTFVTIDGAESAAEAGTVTPAYDWSQTITGAEINAKASEVGIDTSSDVSVTILGAEINVEAGTVHNATAVLTGTLGDGALEAEVVAGGLTLIITLTGDTWIAGFPEGPNTSIVPVSAQSESGGWNAQTPISLAARTSDTVVTITYLPNSNYAITVDEVLTLTISADLIDGKNSIVATPTFTITAEKAAVTGRRKRFRYRVEVDGELIEVSSISEAESVLAQVRELAEEQADQVVTTSTVPKPPKIKVLTASGKPSTSQAIQRATRETQRVVNRAFIEAAKRRRIDAEISQLLIAKIAAEDEEEEAILALLLS